MSAPVISLIGGPTTLIEANGFRLLTDPTFDAPGEYKLPHVTLKKGWLSWTGGTDGFACAHGNGAPSNRKSASDYRRPQPHSQVMDNGIATSSLAVDLLWETRVYRDVSDGYGLHPWRSGRLIVRMDSGSRKFFR